MKFSATPKLRFPDYKDNWLQSKLRDLAKIKSGATPARSNQLYFDGGKIPWVKTTDLTNAEIKSTEEKITELALKETSVKWLPADTILIAMYGGFNQIGRTGLLTKPATTNQALSALQMNEQIIKPRYALIWLNAKVDLWRRFAASSRKDPNITGSDVAGFPIAYPTVEEQERIAGFFSSIDKKINQLKEKHNLLQQYKKGVMQKLFSQEIRFKDENGNDYPSWTNQHLSSLLVLQLNAIDMADDKEYELITVRRRNRGVDSRGIYKGREVLVKNQFELKTNQFVISKRQIVHGACGLVPAHLEGAIVSNEYNVFEPVPEKLNIG
ncbi:MAG: restriction endonuclease subunit S, partial [Algicola sp.]|nr:restriction endonuclease subunit S [Algicola sp.]